MGIKDQIAVVKSKYDETVLKRSLAKAKSTKDKAQASYQSALEANVNTYNSFLDTEHQVQVSRDQLLEVQREYVEILRDADPAEARLCEWTDGVPFIGNEVVDGQLFHMVLHRPEKRVTVYPMESDRSRPNVERGARDMRAKDICPIANYSICSPSSGRGRPGDTPHDAGITTDLAARSRSHHFWNKVQAAWDNHHQRRSRYPTRLYIDFFEGVRRDNLDAMETLMIQSIVQHFDRFCISGQKICRGVDAPVRCNFAMYGVTTLFAGSEHHLDFPARTQAEEDSADWFNDTFRSI